MRLKNLFYLILIIAPLSFAQRNLYSIEPNDSSKFRFVDFGNMWTFDEIPLDTFQARYNFTPDSNWINDVMLSALQFGSGCSAAFVSQNGLIMTNHHCGRNKLKEIELKDENLLRDGFYATKLDEERKVPDLFADQLIFIKDVTEPIINEFNKGGSPKEKILLRNKKIVTIEKENSKKTGLICKVVNLYNGKKFSLYAYKRYDDIRLVMSPDFQIAATGWDQDNFTYPRYELDFMFFRAYEDGKPAKINHFFRLARKPVKENDVVFVIGRPGHTDRRISVAQLNYLKNFTYKQRFIIYDAIYNAYFKLFKNCVDSSKHSTLLNAVMGFGNGRKSYAGRLLGLRDNYLINKKIDFEKKLKNKIFEREELKTKYGNIFNEIRNTLRNLSKISDDYSAFSLNEKLYPEYFSLANKIKEILHGEKNESASEIISGLLPADFGNEYFRKKNILLTASLIKIFSQLIPDDTLIANIFNYSENFEKEARKFYSSTVFTDKNKILELSDNPDSYDILKNDPVIKLANYIKRKRDKLKPKINLLKTKLSVENQILSKAISEIYGDIIPPDATLTLRISDGCVKGYEYNGTIAPATTSFYGLWDRFTSFGKKEYPWGLHPRWQRPPENFNFETNIGFATTNDIVGGNSGSPVINKNAEVVGLIHDGNIESLAGHFIFDPEYNRAVASDIFGILQSLEFIYKTPRLINELKKGEL